MTCTVPPGTFVPHCTWLWWVRIVVLVSSTELLSEMVCQWITFTQHTHTNLFHRLQCQFHFHHIWTAKWKRTTECAKIFLHRHSCILNLGAAKKNDPPRKMWLLSNACIFYAEILLSHAAVNSSHSANFYQNNFLFRGMAQTQSRSSIFATQPLRPTLFMLMFDDLKQMLRRVLTVIVDKTLTAL